MPKKPTKKAANHLRAWREFRGMSQEELAAKADTAGNVISLIESGERGLSHKWLQRLAPLLGTTPGFLLDYDPNDLDAAYLEAVMSVPKGRRQEALEILRILKTGTRD
jgi:transcriptional regulator with XRE-family HTH domain